MRRAGSAIRGRPRLPARFSPRRTRLIVFLGLLDPGLIAANASNDAGGIATYSSVGAKYGYSLLWTIPLITFSLAIVQMLTARMGVANTLMRHIPSPSPPHCPDESPAGASSSSIPQPPKRPALIFSAMRTIIS
jgi:hypothetical protein